MILISHRGNISQPEPDKENTELAIINAVNNHYDCEVDLWRIDDEMFLGHDEPKNIVRDGFLNGLKDHLWCHAKNSQALEFLTKNGYNCFWQDKDDFTLTSKNFIWCHSSKDVYNFGINVLPELSNLKKDDLKNVVGICSDFIENYG